MKRKISMILLVICIILSWGLEGRSLAQPRRIKVPLTEKQMKPYEKIPFTEENFERVERGMTQIQVLKLLGKPIKVKKEHRKHNRWTVHYLYPDGYIVNFKNGLVVGKESGAK